MPSYKRVHVFNFDVFENSNVLTAGVVRGDIVPVGSSPSSRVVEGMEVGNFNVMFVFPECSKVKVEVIALFLIFKDLLSSGVTKVFVDVKVLVEDKSGTCDIVVEVALSSPEVFMTIIESFAAGVD